MTDPDSAVEVQGTIAVRGAANGTNPDAIVAQIEHTRESLAQTIDSIAERVNAVAERPEVRLAAAAVGLTVVSVAIIRIWGRRRK
jgi:Protein of unknown function (DUF3618)